MTPSHTVLVVDDEPDVVKSVHDLLRLEYRVLGATRAAEGARIMRSEEVHVVMTDQRMPEMSGVEFLAQCRNEYPDAIRLLFTGYADIRAVIDAINQGNVYRYITKPWDPDELQTVIREAAERYDLIVARKRLMAELQRTNEELNRANARLRESDALKTAFIRIASHELRTPLTILLGVTDIASRLSPLPEPLPDWLERIRHAGQRLQGLVDQLISMMIAGQYSRPLQRRPTDIAELLKRAAADVRPFIKLREQSLAIDVPEDIGTIHIEPEKIGDSINHLLLNAIKFTPDGGRITLSAARDVDGGAVLRVTDTGIGIDPASLPRIFDPFFVGFDALRHSSGRFEFARKGLGLGLSIVRAFVEMHGGTVDVSSEVGRGTTFTISLPDRPN